jgi:hypothetical protein
VLDTRTSQDALQSPLWDKKEVDPVIFGHWLMQLSKPAATLLFAISSKIHSGNEVAGDIRLIAGDADLSRSQYSRARKELIAQGVLRITGTLARLNPTIAYTAPYGLDNYMRWDRIRDWYYPAIVAESA